MSKLSYKLTYFPLGGRAAAPRMAFYLRGIEYEEDFVAYKAWGDMKKANNMEWGGLPMLTVYDSTTKEQINRFGQSNAILRYAGRAPLPSNDKDESKQDSANGNLLYPMDNGLDCMTIDGVLDAVEELGTEVGGVGKGLEKDDKIAKRQEWWKETGRNKLLKFNDKLVRNKESVYFAGKGMSVADIKFYCSLNSITIGIYDGLDGKFLEEKEFEAMKAFFEAMKSDEKIVAFFKQFEEKLNKYKEANK